MSRVSMRDIGRALGVSAVTVSKALSGKSGVSEPLRQRIADAAAEMGYVNPNAHVTLHALDVGILIPEHYFAPDSYYAMMYKHLVQTLSDVGHFSMLELLSRKSEAALALPNLLNAGRADALILLGEPGRPYLRMLARQKLPLVFLDFYDESACADAVVSDNTYGCSRLTAHLIHAGHSRIGFVGTPQATASIMDRYLGFCRAMLLHDLPIREQWIIPDRDGDNRMLPIALPRELPTAFVCNCDVAARRTIEALSRAGLRVPEDVSVVGYDDFPAQDGVIPLSTFRPDVPAMIQMAVKLVEDRCFNPPRESCSRIVISGQPVYRASHRALSADKE